MDITYFGRNYLKMNRFFNCYSNKYGGRTYVTTGFKAFFLCKMTDNLFKGKYLLFQGVIKSFNEHTITLEFTDNIQPSVVDVNYANVILVNNSFYSMGLDSKYENILSKSPYVIVDKNDIYRLF